MDHVTNILLPILLFTREHFKILVFWKGGEKNKKSKQTLCWNWIQFDPFRRCKWKCLSSSSSSSSLDASSNIIRNMDSLWSKKCTVPSFPSHPFALIQFEQPTLWRRTQKENRKQTFSSLPTFQQDYENKLWNKKKERRKIEEDQKNNNKKMKTQKIINLFFCVVFLNWNRKFA